MPEKNKPIEKDKRNPSKSQDTITVVEANEATIAKLRKEAEKISEKKTGEWKHGDTTVVSPDGKMIVNASGVTYTNGDFRGTLGASTVTEINEGGKDGIQQTNGVGFSGTYTFGDFTDLNPFKIFKKRKDK